MPIRKPRRQTLQELAYPPVPAIGGKDLRADEELLGLKDWEFGDHSTRYPQPLLSSSFDGSRWGGSSVGGSAVGWPSGTNDGSRSSLGVPSSVSSPKKSSGSPGESPTRSEATHHVKRKKPPSLAPDPSTVSSNPSGTLSTVSSSPSKASSVSKPSDDGVIRPGDIVPPDWSAAALSVVGSTPAPTLASVPAPAPTAYKPPPNRRTSQPPPRAPSSAYSHSHSHSQPLISVPNLPPIAASPRSSVVDVVPSLSVSGPRQSAPTQGVSTSLLRPVEKSSTLPPQGKSSMTLQTALQQIASSSVQNLPARPTQVGLSISPRTQPLVVKPSSNEPSSQLLRIPPSTPHGHSSQPAPVASASVIPGSQASGRSPQSRRTLPAPPAQSLVSGTSTVPPVTAQPLLVPQQPSLIHAWRTGVLSSGPRGWGAPMLPPSTQPQPQFQHRSFSGPNPAPTPLPAQSQSFRQYQPAPLLVKTQYQPPPPPHPARSYSYDTPTDALPLPAQIATNPKNYMSSPNVSGGGGFVDDPRPNPSADDGKPGLQRGPSKLRRKLTKNRGWVPNAPAASAPAISASTTGPTAISTHAYVKKSQLAPPAMRTQPNPLACVIPSGGQALVPAQRAFIGTHRSAQERILWGLPLDRDPRVGHAITKIEGMKDAIIKFGVEQFIETKMRGAVICNVDYHPRGYPDELAFDWITYKDAQKTLEPTLQKAVVRNDPATAVIVVIFLLSPSLNSLAIWRKSVPISPGHLDRNLLLQVDRVKRETAGQERDMIIKV